MEFFQEIDIHRPDDQYAGDMLYIHHDQLNLAAFPKELVQKKPALVFIESLHKGKSKPYHPKKLVYVLSSMRHAALNAAEKGFPVLYWRTKESYETALTQIANKYNQVHFHLMQPSEFVSRQQLLNVHHAFPNRSTWLYNTFFLAEPSKWINRVREGYRMEFFYRNIRKQTGYLMHGKEPKGGQWNYDQDNRKKLPKGYKTPSIIQSEPDEVTLEVIDLVSETFKEHFGKLDDFKLAVCRKDALLWLEDFIEHRFVDFGPYEDAMATHEDFINHSLLSTYLNNGLLLAREVCERILEAYEANEHIPLQSVEGIIRQIIGWREYIRIYYEAHADEIHSFNAIGLERSLPDSFWSGKSGLKCVDESLRNVIENGYAHHIQRLMILSNFATLVETHPAELNEWFWYGFTDAYDWVTTPNVMGMSTFADGGILGSKPYVCSGSYVNRMSDYCKSCQYDHKKRTGEGACPLNYLYWHFVASNPKLFEQNGRVSFMLRTYAKKSEQEKEAIQQQATDFIAQIQRYHQRFYQAV